MEIKEAFLDYQYNKRLYDIIIQNISGKSFDLKEKNYKLEFSESSVESFGLDSEGSLSDSDVWFGYWRAHDDFHRIWINRNKIIKVPFSISKFAPNSTMRLRKLENRYSSDKCLYLFIWMVSDGYIYLNISYLSDIYRRSNVYKPIYGEIMEVYDFINNIKNPEKLINITHFKFNMPLK